MLVHHNVIAFIIKNQGTFNQNADLNNYKYAYAQDNIALTQSMLWRRSSKIAGVK